MGRGLLIIALLGLAGAASLSAVSAEAPMLVAMNSVNASGQSGIATLTPLGTQTVIDLKITPGPAGVSQLAHLHAGRCSSIGLVKQALRNVVDGVSRTVVNATIQELAKGNLAVNVHRSVGEVDVAVSCGDIPLL